MYNFQNDLQMLEMGNYQVGEVMPVDYRQDPFQFSDMRRCGGCGRCGGFGVVADLVVAADLVVVVALVVVAVLGLRLWLVCFGSWLFWLLYLAVGEIGGSSSKKFGYFMKGKCLCMSQGHFFFS